MQQLYRDFLESHKRWRQLRNLKPGQEGFPGIRFVFLHSLAHALIRQIVDDAINVNAQTDDSQPPHAPIPRLIHLEPWNSNPPYPFVSLTADYMTLQGAPLTGAGVNEFIRVLSPGEASAFGSMPTRPRKKRT